MQCVAEILESLNVLDIDLHTLVQYFNRKFAIQRNRSAKDEEEIADENEDENETEDGAGAGEDGAAEGTLRRRRTDLQEDGARGPTAGEPEAQRPRTVAASGGVKQPHVSLILYYITMNCTNILK